MLNRLFFSQSGRRDLKTWLNPLIVSGVVALSGYLAYRLSRMPISASNQQMELLIIGLGLVAFSIYCLRNMSFGLNALVFSSAALNFSIKTGTRSTVVLAIVVVFVLTGVWIIRMLVFDRRLHVVNSSLNLPIFSFLVVVLLSWAASYTIVGWDINLPPNILVVQAGQVALFVLSGAAFWLFANHPVSDRTLKMWTGAIIIYGSIAFTFEVILRRNFYAEAMNGAMLMWPVVLLVSQLLFNPQLDSRWRLAGFASLGVWAVWVATRTFEFKGSWVPAVLGIGILILLRNARLGMVFGVLGGIVLLTSNFGQAFFRGESASLLRPMIWWDVIRMGLRSPFLGLGPVKYMFHWADPTFVSITFQQSHTYAWTRFNFAPPSHNLFVDVFAQTGIIGSVLFLWFLAAVGIFGWQMRKRFSPGFHSGYVNGVYAGFMAIAISSAPFADWLVPFVYNIGLKGFAHSVYSWLLLGTLVALDHRMKVNQDDRAP